MLVHSQEISKAMRKLRVLSEMPTTEIAKYLDVQHTMVWRYERGRCGINYSTLIRLARLANSKGFPEFAAIFLDPISAEMGTTAESLRDFMRRAA